MALSIKISDTLSLTTGDKITLQADDGTFLKRFVGARMNISYGYSQLDRYSLLMCLQAVADEFSKFQVTVVDSNRICLKADNGKYLKRISGILVDGLSCFIMDPSSPDEYSYFTVTPKGSNKVTLRADNGQFLRRYTDVRIADGKSFIIPNSIEDGFSLFTVRKA
ncbi:MAG: fascin domain-containing protein [Synechococcaceae cyanobacterium]